MVIYKHPANVVKYYPKLDKTIDCVVDNLRDGYKQLQTDTMLHVDDLVTKRRKGAIDFLSAYSADGFLYFMDGTTPKLAVLRNKDNLILRHIDEAYTQLEGTEIYRPNVDEAQAVIRALDTVVVDLTKLHLIPELNGLNYLLINTAEPSLNDEELRFAQRITDSSHDFYENMNHFKKNRISEVKIYVPKFADLTKRLVSGPIMGASRLDLNSGTANFHAAHPAVQIRARMFGKKLLPVGKKN